MLGERTIEGDAQRDTEPCVILTNTQHISDVSDTDDENICCASYVYLCQNIVLYT